MFSDIKSWILKHKKQTIICSILVAGIIIITMTYTFASNTPLRSVRITSENTSYEDEEPGSWSVGKSARWTDKGEAEITLTADTRFMTDVNSTDVIVVLETSNSMVGNKLTKAKQDIKELFNNLLTDTEANNRAALITFNSSSDILSNLTNDLETLTNQVDGVSGTGDTNHYQALVNVDNLLKNYTKEKSRELIVLFLTTSYPNVDTPNQISQYQYLKNEYPYIIINGIQYEMGNTILKPISQISDYQYIAKMETLRDVLYDCSIVPVTYEKFEVVDYIDNQYFELESEDDIKVSDGEVKVTEENGTQKITWTIPNFRSGSDADLTMNVKLKEEYINQGGIYPTNEKYQVITKIKSQEENVTSTQTPALADNYKVIYDGNDPSGCTVENVPSEQTHSVYNTIEISEQTPKCNGYEFKGWEIATDNVEKINDNYFIMPESNVTLRANWSKVELAKSMDGEIYETKTLYEVVEDQATMDNISSTYVSSSNGIDFSRTSSNTNGRGVYTRAGTENDRYPVHYFRGNVNNNYVNYAGYCWKMVRTTSTGGVKLMYEGTISSTGACISGTSGIGSSRFNSDSSHEYGATTSPGDVGYMYGTRYRPKSLYLTNKNDPYVYGNTVTWNGYNYTILETITSNTADWDKDRLTLATKYHYTCLSTSNICTTVYYGIDFTDSTTIDYLTLTNGEDIERAKKKMFSNTTESVIKTFIDDWFEQNITTEYRNYLEDTTWCNDRSIISGALKGEDEDAGNGRSYFGPYERTNITHEPSLVCSSKDDVFTVDNSEGNGLLTYPIALLTADEALLAGITWNSANENTIFSDKTTWLLSPASYITNSPTVIIVQDGVFKYGGSQYPVKPSVSLSHEVLVRNGDGTSASPYEILLP